MWQEKAFLSLLFAKFLHISTLEKTTISSSILELITHMKKFLDSDWLRAVQFFWKTSAEKRKFK